MVQPPPVEKAHESSAERRTVFSRGLDDGLVAQPPEWRVRFKALPISTILHATVLVLMALMVKHHVHESRMVLELSSAERQSIDFVEVSRLDVSSFEESEDEEFVTPAVDLMELVALSEIAPPDLLARPVQIESSDSNSASSEQSSPSKKKEGVSFFGTHAYGSKFVYVLDISGSMLAGNGRRIQRARNELVRSLSQLRPEHQFYVVLYNQRAFKLFDRIAKARLLPATKENKEMIAKWIFSVQPWGGTMPASALEIAGDLSPDAVFFLSDGEFVYESTQNANSKMERFLQGFAQARPGVMQGHPLGSTRSPKNVLDEYDPKIVVHTIALENQGSSRLMETISKSKGGQHRFIREQPGGNMPRRRGAR